MVTVFFKDHPPVVVKNGEQTERHDFQFRVMSKDSCTLIAEFSTGSVIGYMLEAPDDPKAD